MLVKAHDSQHQCANARIQILEARVNNFAKGRKMKTYIRLYNSVVFTLLFHLDAVAVTGVRMGKSIQCSPDIPLSSVFVVS